MAAADAGRPATVVDLSDLEVDDGPELARLVTRLRARAASGERLVLESCPQLLAHTLYKAGVLARGELTLGSVRQEEPYG